MMANVKFKSLSITSSKVSDVQVRVGQITFYCHKRILQLNSDHFAMLPFTSGAPTTLQGIDPDVFCDVLEFMYKGKVRLCDNNIETTLAAADALRMDDLKEICFGFLEKNLTAGNVLEYMAIAKKYRDVNLLAKCQKKCASTFIKQNTPSRLKTTSEEILKGFLAEDRMNVTSEEEVCETLLKWLEVQSEEGNEVHPEQLLPLIRWSAINVDYIKTKLLQNTMLMSNQACTRFLSKVISHLVTGVQFESLQTFHTVSIGIENCLIIVGLDYGKRMSSKVHRITLEQPDRVSTAKLIPAKIWYESRGCASGSNIYVTGTGRKHPHNETWRLDLLSGDWFRCADMITGRKFHCVAIVDSQLYVLGGRANSDSKLLNSVECYSMLTNSWSPADNLKKAVDCAACVTYNNSIYVFGGFDRKCKPTTHVQVYNPAEAEKEEDIEEEEPRCTLINEPMPGAMANCSAVLWQKSVILINRRTCLVYNLETKTWRERERFRINVGYSGLALDGQTIYIAGGGRYVRDKDNRLIVACSDVIKCVSVLDIIQDREPRVWNRYAQLPKPSHINAFCIRALPH